jgi:hypothetical protein
MFIVFRQKTTWNLSYTEILKHDITKKYRIQQIKVVFIFHFYYFLGNRLHGT